MKRPKVNCVSRVFHTVQLYFHIRPVTVFGTIFTCTVVILGEFSAHFMASVFL